MFLTSLVFPFYPTVFFVTFLSFIVFTDEHQVCLTFVGGKFAQQINLELTSSEVLNN